jgi:hypothetical protein
MGGRGPVAREYDRDFYGSGHPPTPGSAISQETLEERRLTSQREEAEWRAKEELRAQFFRLWNPTARLLIALRNAKYLLAADEVDAARQGLLARAEEVARMAATISDAERRQQLTALERSCRKAVAQIATARLP